MLRPQGRAGQSGSLTTPHFERPRQLALRFVGDDALITIGDRQWLMAQDEAAYVMTTFVDPRLRAVDAVYFRC